MPILRNPKTNRFVQIDNELLETSRLTWKAKAILCYLLSKPDNWKFNMTDIANRSKGEGLDAIRTVIHELQDEGYLTRQRVRSVSKGRFGGWEYFVRETPLPPTLDSPTSDCPMSVEAVYSNTVPVAILTDSNTTTQEKKCPPPSKTREIGLVSPEIKRIANELLNPSKRIPSAEHTSTAGKEQKRCALNCIVDLKLSRIPKGTMPSMEWLDEFVELYSPLWNADEINAYLLDKRRYRSVHDPEKYLTAFFEKMEDDRTGKRKAA